MLTFAIHSTFRDSRGRQLFPDGLQWDLPGESVMAYVAIGYEDDRDEGREIILSDTLPLPPNGLAVRRGILHAHNRWMFAKDLPFRRLEDIVNVSLEGPHFLVEWKLGCHLENKNFHEDASDVLKKTAVKRARNIPHVKDDGDSSPPPKVWVNGVYQEELTMETLPGMLETVRRHSITKICCKTSSEDDGQLIRVDRYFRGGLSRREDVFVHIMDNLIAMEDPRIVNDETLIGTATLPDWIMGGELTSRVHIRELGNGDVLFLRPLYGDKIETSDRRFKLKAGKDDGWIARVRRELNVLRAVATLPCRSILDLGQIKKAFKA